MGLFGNSDDNREGGGQQSKFRQIFELAKPVLNLTPDQEKQAREIFQEFRHDRQEIKQAGDKDGDGDIKNEMQDARHEAKEKIMALLTDEQKKLFEDNIQKWRGQVG